MEQSHRKGGGGQGGDSTCESGDAYLHANYATRRGERLVGAPHSPDRERAREERRSRRERETRGMSERANGQTKRRNQRGPVDETGNYPSAFYSVAFDFLLDPPSMCTDMEDRSEKPEDEGREWGCGGGGGARLYTKIKIIDWSSDVGGCGAEGILRM